MIQAKWPSHVPELDVAINTGIRKGSQYGLTWDMVDWKSRELHIPNTETKNGEPLHVPLNDTAIAAFKVVFEGGTARDASSNRGKLEIRLRTGGTGSMTRLWRRGLRIFFGTTCATRLQADCECRALHLRISQTCWGTRA